VENSPPPEVYAKPLALSGKGRVVLGLSSGAVSPSAAYRTQSGTGFAQLKAQWTSLSGPNEPPPGAQKGTPRPAKESNMSDPITRDELTAKLETIEARADARFAEIMGEIKASNATLAGKIETASAKTAGKWTVVASAAGAAATVIATIIVLTQVAQTSYDTGVNAEQRAAEAAKEAAIPSRNAVSQ